MPDPVIGQIGTGDYVTWSVLFPIVAKMARDIFKEMRDNRNGNANEKSSELKEIKDNVALLWNKFDDFKEKSVENFVKLGNLSTANTHKIEIEIAELKTMFKGIQDMEKNKQELCNRTTIDFASRIHSLEEKTSK